MRVGGRGSEPGTPAGRAPQRGLVGDVRFPEHCNIPTIPSLHGEGGGLFALAASSSVATVASEDNTTDMQTHSPRNTYGKTPLT